MRSPVQFLKSNVPRLKFAIDERPEDVIASCSDPLFAKGPEREFYTLLGWVFFPFSPVVLELRYGSLMLTSLVPGDVRNDVAECYPSNSRSQTCGFSLRVPSALLRNVTDECSLSLVAHYAGKQRVLWSFDRTILKGKAAIANDERTVLDQYYPERLVSSSDISDRIATLLRSGEIDQDESHLMSKTRDSLNELSQFDNVLYIFGAFETQGSGAKLFQECLQHASAFSRYHICYVAPLSSPKLEQDEHSSALSLEALLTFHASSPLPQAAGYLVADWRLIKDAFLAKKLIGGGEVVHLIDSDEMSIKVEPYQRQAFQCALHSYANVACKDDRVAHAIQHSLLLPEKPSALFTEAGEFLDGVFSKSSQPQKRALAMSVVVPVFNALECTLRCLRSVLSAVSESDEIIVVDDKSDSSVSEKLEEFCRLYSSITYVRREDNGGFIEACYTGLAAAQPLNDLLLVNSDVVLAAETLLRFKDAIREDPSIGLASPLSTGSYTLKFDSVAGHSYFDASSWLYKNITPRYPEVITPEGQCLYISRDVITRFGFFDRVYERGFCEESDLGMRAVLHGARLACIDNALVFHEQSASFEEAVRSVHYERNRPVFEKRWGKYFTFLERHFTPQLTKTKIQERYRSEHIKSFDIPEVPHAAEDVIDGKLDSISVEARHSGPMELPGEEDIVFVLPSVIAGGGSLSILQHAQEMSLRGYSVKIISFSPVRELSFPSLVEVLSLTPQAFLEIPWKNQQLIATFWSTAYPVSSVCREHPGVTGWYYVQDYEPWFHRGDERLVHAAEKTYGFGLQAVAKTEFLVDIVQGKHDVRVEKISPGVATDVFYPGHQDRHAGRLRVSALFRPETPRRGPRETLELIRIVKERLPEVEFTLFGSTSGIPQEVAEHVTLTGRLSQRRVAELYRNSDVVLDMSTWQGFGRMGIEAMSAGAVPVLSNSGGVLEYARDGENALIFDPSCPEAAAEIVCMLASDRELRLKLRSEALRTSTLYAESEATDDWLRLFAPSSMSKRAGARK